MINLAPYFDESANVQYMDTFSPVIRRFYLRIPPFEPALMVSYIS